MFTLKRGQLETAGDGQMLQGIKHVPDKIIHVPKRPHLEHGKKFTNTET